MKKFNRKKKKEVFNLECTITGEKFKTTRQAPNPDELLSVKAYYEMNPEDDDRSEKVRKILGDEEIELAPSENEEEAAEIDEEK